MIELKRKATITTVHRRADGTVVEETIQEVEIDNGDD